MSIVAGTRLRLRSAWYLLPFVWDAHRARGQARDAPGFLGGQLLRSDGLVFWTLTLWAGEEPMRRYRNHDPHKAAMARTARWCDEVVTAHWAQDGDDLPGWDDVAAKLARDGRFLKLPHASARHLAHEVPAPVNRAANVFGPKR